MNKSLLVFSVMLAEVNKATNKKQRMRSSKTIVPRLNAWHPIPRSASSKLLWHSIVHLRDRVEIRRKNSRWTHLISVSPRTVGPQARSTEDRQEVSLLAFCVTRACLSQGPASGQCADHRLPSTAPGMGEPEQGADWGLVLAPHSQVIPHVALLDLLQSHMAHDLNKVRDALYKMRPNPSVCSSIDLVNQHNALRFFSKGLKLGSLWKEGKFKQKAFLFLYIPT